MSGLQYMIPMLEFLITVLTKKHPTKLHDVIICLHYVSDYVLELCSRFRNTQETQVNLINLGDIGH